MERNGWYLISDIKTRKSVGSMTILNEYRMKDYKKKCCTCHHKEGRYEDLHVSEKHIPTKSLTEIDTERIYYRGN
jgi:hypothetical protein